MRDIWLGVLLGISLIAFVCVFVAMFKARIGQLDWWLDEEEAESRPRRRFAFVHASWFFYAAGGTFVTTALALMFLMG